MPIPVANDIAWLNNYTGTLNTFTNYADGYGVVVAPNTGSFLDWLCVHAYLCAFAYLFCERTTTSSSSTYTPRAGVAYLMGQFGGTVQVGGDAPPLVQKGSGAGDMFIIRTLPDGTPTASASFSSVATTAASLLWGGAISRDGSALYFRGEIMVPGSVTFPTTPTATVLTAPRSNTVVFGRLDADTLAPLWVKMLTGSAHSLTAGNTNTPALAVDAANNLYATFEVSNRA